MRTNALLALLGLLPCLLGSPLQPKSQLSFSSKDLSAQHVVDESIYMAMERYDDPVLALLSIQPELAETLAEKRLIQVFGDDGPVWMTEGDKLRLRRERKKFMDVTDFHDDSLHASAIVPQEPHMPPFTQHAWVKPCFEDVDTNHMRDVLTHMTSYYNRYYHHVNGARSATWLHNHILDIIKESPFQTYISLEYHTHWFMQPSIIARFEPPIRNASAPLTIIGAHQDSANYAFPLLPAPGADDDMSGSVSILEAFRVLAMRGFIPERGPVEFHWYAAEEAGLLGSQAIAKYKKDQQATIGAMMEFDMTAFIFRNATESINFIIEQSNSNLTNWAVDLSKEYIDLTTRVLSSMGPNAGSDYMSFTQQGFPAAFATEGDPSTKHSPMGDFDPYVHTDRDRMDVDNELGVFSIDHMAQFSRLAIAFAVEQAKWSTQHRRERDGTHV
ncbi:peptidase family M28 [Kockovaella imperatae]|uniref:Peptide hydrolase n=1 Tax=Kockovaella imperatae TaxID=4999 RepID=A0A1Y1UKY2_9TREE|nr:peptidase family M28 [Kockovaella imperatae]ORX38701.1 peptidase family M28 [Kockovaella imperatae]